MDLDHRADAQHLDVETPATIRQQLSVALGLDPRSASELSSLLDEAKQRNWRWHLAREHHPAGRHTRGALVDWLPDDERVRTLHKLGCPVVRLGKRPHPKDDKVPAVLPDIAAAAQMAADHFSHRAFRNVAFFGHLPWGDSKTLYEEFDKHSKERGMSCHLYRIKRHKGERPRDSTMRQNCEFIEWVQNLPRPVGLLAPGAAVAANFCNLLLESNIDIPEDVAILAATDSRVFCECMTPSISAIKSSGEELLHTACNLLDNMIQGKEAPLTPIMVQPTEIIERESTRILATSDKRVSTALRYMWDNLDRNISVENIAQASGLSSRQLKRRFNASLKRGINEELRRLRLNEFTRLLTITSHTIEELAPLVGFQSKVYLHRAFRKTFGMTPAQYRRKHHAQ